VPLSPNDRAALDGVIDALDGTKDTIKVFSVAYIITFPLIAK